ncbi:histidine phosphatase family protein [uncultured Catenibacterium sp.]|uniref:histidine phosphatase family protein n=1 Tax=uncultured Catenibacterium sp. TaxID=286142 RepID=UPI0025E3D038|nr:histidine phosphatase family protein [uncultured Catenibacterium sp.]
MKFIFVRHGKTHFNEINLTQGWCDSPLSQLGVKQVENMSLQLKDYCINKAYTSPLGRAVETSEIILQSHNIAPIYDKRLKEVNFGILEGINTQFVRELHVESSDWMDTLEMDYRPYKGEDLHSVITRQRAVINDIVENSQEDDTILVVGHGCSLYGLVKTLVPHDARVRFPDNATAIIVDYKEGYYSLNTILNAVY